MRFMAIVKATKDSEAGALPTPDILEAMGKFNEELVKAGVMEAGEGLQASAKGARVHFSGTAKPTVKDGPFTETKELIAGFWILRVKSREEAIEWIKRSPNPYYKGDGYVEIRQIFDTDDFAPSDPTGELRDAELRLREQVDRQKKS
jgi:hypothetical protein